MAAPGKSGQPHNATQMRTSARVLRSRAQLDGPVFGELGTTSQVTADPGLAAISAGNGHALGLRDGAVVGWDIQPDESGPSPQSLPPAETQSGVSAIAAGGYHSLALKDGGVIAWGYAEGRETRVPVEAQANISAIAAGEMVSIAVSTLEIRPPSVVTKLRVKAKREALGISWTPPADLGGAPSVTYELKINNEPWRLRTPTRFVAYGGSGQRMTVQVRAVNGTGPGPATKVSAVLR